MLIIFAIDTRRIPPHQQMYGNLLNFTGIPTLTWQIETIIGLNAHTYPYLRVPNINFLNTS
jgi:hypothetical protein